MPPTSPKQEFNVLITGYGPFRDHKINPSWLAVRTLRNTVLEMLVPGSAESDVAKIRISAFKVPVVYDKVLDAVPKVHQAGWSPSTNGISLDGDGPQKPLPSDPNEETDNPADYAVPPTPASGYDFILHVGVAGKGNMRVEKQADKLGYKSPDVEQKFAEIVDWEEVEVPKEGEDGENKEKEKVRVPVRGFGKGYEAFEKELKTGLDLTQLVQHLHESGIMEVGISNDSGRFLCGFIFYASLAEAVKTQSGVPVLFLHVPPVGEPLTTESVAEGIRKIVIWVCRGLVAGEFASTSTKL